MAAKSPGKDRRGPRSKGDTRTSKKHRFESFTRRISRLKIDPVHAVQGRTPTDNASDLSQSFFRTALDEWAELNQSATFTLFLNKVNPLCENLPQILHHQEQIFDLLLQAIEKEDALALEPIMSLTAHLAHDLGQEFNQYFPRTVSSVAHVAARHDAPDVIEWCFTCLAWVFKYLSRLLVQDLRPLLGIMKPYFSHRKDYVARFSAESLAFLLRKAAVSYPKRREPLTIALTDLLRNHDRDDPQAEYGSMALLVETCSGMERGVHSSANCLFQCLVNVAGQLCYPPGVLRLVEGAVISLVHRTDAAGFRPILSVLVEFARTMQETPDVTQKIFTVTLLQAAIGTRSGTRIEDWKPVLETVVALSNSVSTWADDNQPRKVVVSTSAFCLQYAPLDQLLPFSTPLLDPISQQLSARDFFAYCTLTSDLGQARFRTLVLPRLQQYIVSSYNSDELGLLCLLEYLYNKGAISPNRNSPGYVESSKAWDEAILVRLANPEDTGKQMSDDLLAGIGQLGLAARFPVDSSRRVELSGAFATCIGTALDGKSGTFTLRDRLALGWLFSACIRLALTPAEVSLATLERAANAPGQCYSMIPFLEALLSLGQLENASRSFQLLRRETTRELLVQNLTNCSMEMRVASLRLIGSMESGDDGEWLSETTDILLEICKTEYTPSHARDITMLLRRLPHQQNQAPSDSMLQQLIPLFCLGLLPIYHDQTRKDVCITLRELIEASDIEDSILQILTSWLRSSVAIDDSPGTNIVTNRTLTPFECSNLMRIREASDHAFELLKDPGEHLRARAQAAHQIETSRTPHNARGLALQALAELSRIAEKRSRQITPIFLAAQLTRTTHDSPDQSDTSESSHTLSPEIAESGWTFSDRKAFLLLLSQFQNPKVLYRSKEVHDKLLDMLCNGNQEIRKLSLTAILNWNEPILKRHEQILYQVIEEKVPNAEIGIMLNSESADNPIQSGDRSTILPILLRLLYGLIVGRTGTSGSQEARRKAILRMLFRMEEDEVAIFLNIALGTLKGICLSPTSLPLDGPNQQSIPSDQQYGFLRMVLTLMETLQTQFAPYGKYVAQAVLYCTLRACRQMEKPGGSGGAMTTNIRRAGLQCLNLLFEQCPDIDWDAFMTHLFAEAISPRLHKLAVETAQGISVLLRLFSTWAHSTRLICYLHNYDNNVIPATLQLLALDSAKNDVKAFVLKDILVPLVELAQTPAGQPNQATEVLSVEMSPILQGLGAVLQNTPAKEILAPTTWILTQVAPMAAASGGTGSILALLVDVLATSRRQLTPQARSGVLVAILRLLQADLNSIDPISRDKLFELISRLFNYFKDRESRLTLCDIIQCLEGQFDAQLASLCSDLNAFSSERLDEIDYERRSSAFQQVSELTVDEDSAERWLPILYNLLFFLRHEDFSIRSKVVSCLKEFIITASAGNSEVLRTTMTNVLLPAFQDGARDDSEMARADAVMLFGMLVQHLDHEPRLEDLRALLVGNDEEASFFTNILHVQQHRRLRAIRRLVAEVGQGTITSRNIANYFLPLLQKFVRDPSTDASVQGVKGDSLSAMRTILQWVEWKQFKSIFMRYKSELDADESIQKTAVRLLANAADSLAQAYRDRQQADSAISSIRLSHLAASLPSDTVFTQEVSTQLLSKLGDFSHYKDEAEISARLPVATTAIKLIVLLPMNETQVLSAPIVLDVANALRSRAQESRDAARSALKDMTSLLGPGSLQFVLSELRSVLKRGFQLHVLSFTLHSILVSLSPTMQLGDLDYCLSDIVSVVMDDIFGVVGQEKDNQDYVSSMREVKSSKSFDSMELITRSTSVDRLKLLIEPLTMLLSGSLTAKQTRQVDELLRRIGVGLSRNPAAGSRELLTFAYQVIQNFYKQRIPTKSQNKTNDELSRERLLIQLSSASKIETSSSSPLLYKIARFAIDLVRSTLQKHGELLKTENVHGFLPVIGDTLMEAQEDVKISALRLLSAIIKLRMPEMDEATPMYVREAVRMVQNANSTNDEAAQAALKLIAAVLRERKSVKVRDSDVADLLHRITPDLEEPDRQGVSFNFVRAVMSRKFQLPEVYEVVDRIGVIMVTNQSRGARDVARGVYVHFLIEYPQSANRWTKQQKFLTKNLEYDYPEGRESVMEAINTLLNKTSGDLGQELVSTFFVPLVLRMANDDHEECSALARALLGRIFRKVESSKRKGLLQPLEAWIEQRENPPLTKLAMQAFGVLFEAVDDGLDAQVRLVCRCIEVALKSPASDEGDLPGEALKLLLRLTESRPDKTLTQKSASIWTEVRGLLQHPFASIQVTAASLTATFFQHCQPTSMHELPLQCSHGLSWDEGAIRDVLKASARIVKGSQEATVHQRAVSVLLYLGRCIDTNGLTVPVKSTPSTADPESNSEDDDPVAANEGSVAEATTSILAIYYLLHQLTLILRRETSSHHVGSLLPKTSALQILNALIPQLRASTLDPRVSQRLLLPLIHLNDPATHPPRSTDPQFASTYTALLVSAQELMTALQDRLGDKAYISAMTEASKIVRERRQERRRKRVIEKVSEPEIAARRKKLKGDRKKERKREIGQQFSMRRKGRGW